MMMLALLLGSLILVRLFKFEWWWYVIVCVIWFIGLLAVGA